MNIGLKEQVIECKIQRRMSLTDRSRIEKLQKGQDSWKMWSDIMRYLNMGITWALIRGIVLGNLMQSKSTDQRLECRRSVLRHC